MSKKEKPIKQPVTTGAAKVPVIMQMEALECGAACLTMILAYYGHWVPLEQVRADCGVSRDGSNAKNVLRAARSYGLTARGYRFEPEALKESGKFPCIIHWNFNHFVVLCGFKGDKAVINDPAQGNYAVPMEVFDRSFTGICLMFEPGEGFEPGGKPKSVLAFAKQRMKGAGEAVAFTIITTVITTPTRCLRPGAWRRSRPLARRSSPISSRRLTAKNTASSCAPRALWPPPTVLAGSTLTTSPVNPTFARVVPR